MNKSTLMILALISGLFVSSMFVTSCGSKKEQNSEEHEHTETDTTSHHHDEMKMDSTAMHDMDTTQVAYACPMHPEVTGKEGDKCSKCGMKLAVVKEPIDDHAH